MAGLEAGPRGQGLTRLGGPRVVGPRSPGQSEEPRLVFRGGQHGFHGLQESGIIVPTWATGKLRPRQMTPPPEPQDEQWRPRERGRPRAPSSRLLPAPGGQGSPGPRTQLGPALLRLGAWWPWHIAAPSSPHCRGCALPVRPKSEATLAQVGKQAQEARCLPGDCGQQGALSAGLRCPSEAWGTAAARAAPGQAGARILMTLLRGALLPPFYFTSHFTAAVTGAQRGDEASCPQPTAGGALLLLTP